jgi:hypothetical protein
MRAALTLIVKATATATAQYKKRCDQTHEQGKRLLIQYKKRCDQTHEQGKRLLILKYHSFHLIHHT